MAQTETKTYLINFQDNLNAYAQHAADAKKEVDRLAESNKKLKASGADAKEIEKSNAALKTATQEYKNSQKNVETATKANIANKDSYEQLYRQWQLAQTQLKLVGNAFTVNEKGVRVLSESYIKQSKVVADAKANLDAFGKGIHDNRLNVGSYSEAIEGAMGKFEKLPGPLASVAEGAKGVNKTFWSLVMNPIGAIIAAIVLALVGLYKIFTSTAEGGGKMKDLFASLQAIMDVLRNRVVKLIEVFKDIFTGQWKKAGQDLKATFANIGDEIRNAASEAAKLSKMQRQLTKDLSMHISEEANEENMQARLMFLAKDKTKSDQERMEALKEAMKLSREQADKEEMFAQRQLDIDIGNAALKGKVNKDALAQWIGMDQEMQKSVLESSQIMKDAYNLLGSETLKALEEQQAKVTAANTEFYQRNKRAMSQLSTLQNELAKDREAKEKSAVELRLARLNQETDRMKSALLEQYQQAQLVQGLSEVKRKEMATKYNDDLYAIEVAQGEKMKAAVKIEYDTMLRQVDLSESERILIKIEYQNAINAIDEENRKTKFALDMQALEAEKAATEDFIAKGEEIRKRDADARYEYERTAAGNNVAALMEIANEEWENFKRTSEFKNATLQEKALYEQQYTSTVQQLSQMRMDQQGKELDALGNFFGAMSQLLGESTAAGKGFAVAQTLINTYKSATSAFAGMTEAIPGPIGIAAGVVAAAAAVAMGLANVKKILSVSPKGSGASGGGGEARSSLSMAAAHVTAKPVGPTVLSPTTSPQAITNQAQTQQLTADAITQALQRMPPPVVTVEDINAKTGEKAKVEVRATV